MGYSRQLYLSDCARLVENEPGLVVGSIVDHGITACWEIACGGSTSFAEAIDGDQPNRPGTAFLRSNPEYIGRATPIQTYSFPVGKWVVIQIVDKNLNGCAKSRGKRKRGINTVVQIVEVKHQLRPGRENYRVGEVSGAPGMRPDPCGICRALADIVSTTAPDKNIIADRISARTQSVTRTRSYHNAAGASPGSDIASRRSANENIACSCLHTGKTIIPQGEVTII